MNKKSYILLLKFIITDALLILLSLVGGISFFVDTFDFFVRPFSTQLKSMNNSTVTFFNTYLGSGEIQKKNFELNKDIIALKEKVNNYDDIKKENDFLRSKVDGPRIVNTSLTLTKVISASSVGSLIIDRGSVNGVKDGDIIVISDTTVLGRVSEVYQFTSKVELIGYSKSGSKGVSVFTTQDGKEVKGFLTNDTDQNKLLVQDILKSNPVSKGAIFSTTGDDKIYPRGLVVGTVNSVTEKDTQTAKIASISFDYDISLLSYVYILNFNK
jgi:rod shape-determining protein MreC